MRPDEVVRATQCHDPVAQVAGDAGKGRIVACGKGDQAGNHREDILDPVAQFTADDLALFQCQLLLMDVGAGAEPAGDLPRRIADRQGAAQDPAIGAIAVPQAIFDLIGDRPWPLCRHRARARS